MRRCLGSNMGFVVGFVAGPLGLIIPRKIEAENRRRHELVRAWECAKLDDGARAMAHLAHTPTVAQLGPLGTPG